MQEKDALDSLRAAYKEQGDLARHYSTVRSALTTFLLAAALAALSEFRKLDKPPSFLLAAGCLLLLAAFVVCMIFSYRTEKTILRYKKYWTGVSGERSPAVVLAMSWHQHADQTSAWELRSEIVCRMLCDPINWFLIVGIGTVVWAVRNPHSLTELLEKFHLL